MVACFAHIYPALFGARILLVVAAGLYVPNANALASAVVDPSRRGTALSIVTGGFSVAVALGVPLGALVGDRFGWRLNFVTIGVLALKEKTFYRAVSRLPSIFGWSKTFFSKTIF